MVLHLAGFAPKISLSTRGSGKGELDGARAAWRRP
jgi:hypothetical protein